MQVNMHEAKSSLSRLGERVICGERVVIARAGKPYLELMPYRASGGARTPGRLKGQIRMAADFDDLPEEVIRAFSGEAE
ncbi:type II toxin-antitoxin system prevent-host-death family antitoxin [Aquisalimonas sp. 2447]|nr:type II toxin-antitoxin system prevent-host-death family antitoxin [Aquisalimonas sp. 2447]